MSAFLIGVDSLFYDPNLSEAATWRSLSSGVAIITPVRIIRKAVDSDVSVMQTDYEIPGLTIDVRLSDVIPQIGDQIDLQNEDGTLQKTVVIFALTASDPIKNVRTVEAKDVGA